MKAIFQRGHRWACMAAAALLLVGCEKDDGVAELLEKSKKIAVSPDQEEEGNAQFMRQAFEAMQALSNFRNSYDDLGIQIKLMNVSGNLVKLNRTAQTEAAARQAMEKSDIAVEKLKKSMAQVREETLGLEEAAKGDAFKRSVFIKIVALGDQVSLAQTSDDPRDKERMNEMFAEVDDYLFQWNLSNGADK